MPGASLDHLVSGARGVSSIEHRSFNHLVGLSENGWRNLDPKLACCLEVDHHFEVRRVLDGQTRRVFATQNAIRIACRSPIGLNLIEAVGDEPARKREETEGVYGGHMVLVC